jgi:hypothetical protein
MWGLIPPHTCHNNLPLKCESSIHHAPSQAETFSSIHVHLRWPHSEDSPPDHLCREDFWYKESIELFVELYISSDTTAESRGGQVHGEFFFRVKSVVLAYDSSVCGFGSSDTTFLAVWLSVYVATVGCLRIRHCHLWWWRWLRFSVN